MTWGGILRTLVSQALLVSVVFLTRATVCTAGIVVRSGEHPNFSRLVFDINPPVSWNLVRASSGYILTIDTSDEPADLSRVFSFIPRKRLLTISALAHARGTYNLGIAQAFHAEAFEISPGRLVIDIKPGTAPPFDTPPPPISSEKNRNETPYFPVDIKEPSAQQAVLQPPNQHIELETTNPVIEPPPEALSGQLKPETYGATGKDIHRRTETIPRIAVLRAQESLVRQLGRAMTQGVITPSSSASGTVFSDAGNLADVRRTEYDETIRESAAKNRENDAADTLRDTARTPYLDHLNLEAQTVFDREITDRISQTRNSLDGGPCIKDSELDVASWSPEDDAGLAIAELRSTLIGEFDKPDLRKFTELVQLYVAEGMGTEALALMSSFSSTKIKNAALLTELAQIIETGKIKTGQLLASQASCSGAAALWALLARPEIPPGEVPDSENLTRHFARLTVDLRRRIGPRLGTKLLRAGFVDKAESIERLVARAPGKDGPDLLLFQARIDLARDRTAQARLKLRNIIDTNSANAQDAVLLLIETYLAGSGPIPESLITEVSARAFEARRGKFGIKLLRAELLALAKTRRQMTALEILAHEEKVETIGQKTVNALAGEVFSTFKPENLDAAKFTRAFFKFRNMLSRAPEHDTARRHIAKALVTAGLPSVALGVLVPLSGRMQDQDRALYGQIFLATGRPRETLSILSGVRSAKANALRVKAFSALGRYDRAFAAADKINSLIDPEMPFLAWRAGQWGYVAANDPTSRGPAAAYIEDGPTDAQTPDFAKHLEAPKTLSLTSLNELLAQSRASREVLSTLLAENPKP